MPPMEPGIWNGWVFTICLVLRHPVMKLINRKVWAKLGAPAHMPLSTKERNILLLAKVTKWVIFAYSVFLPLKVGTTWFYVGLPISVAGAVLYGIVWVNFATAPIDEPVTRGLYRYSRHPMRLTPFVTLLGVSIATSSWLFLGLSMVFTVSSSIGAIPEERFWLERYGSAFRRYRDRTPRWIGRPR
jgi:protein-S-isoprenylcysteine O-methyltransferase Ste14